MTELRSSAAHASVAHLRIAGFARSPAADRATIKKQLEADFVAAIGRMPETDRIVLDAPEGMALVVLANPAAALRFANRVMAQSPSRLKPAIGLSHGPVRVVEDASTGPTLVGGALSEAAMVARFANAGTILAARSFREALIEAVPARGRHLDFAGTMTDERDRAYELFHAEDERIRHRRRRFFVAAGSIAVAMLLLGGLGTALRSRQPGIVELEITPAGEVFVNGVSKGSSPPLERLELPAGRHEVEIRSGRHKPFQQQIEVVAGEKMILSHSFAGPSSPRRSFKQRVFDFFK